VAGSWRYDNKTGLGRAAHLNPAQLIHRTLIVHDVRKDRDMAFPPNYSQERKAREAAKQRKAREKLQKRSEKSADNKHENKHEGEPGDAPVAEPEKEL
jgi:hypothetical protein